jgi:cysteine desulfurase
VFPEAAEAMVPFLTEFGNPSSGHDYGRRTAAAVAAARASVAALVGAAPEEVHFCGCGTEADAWAIEGAVFAARRRGAARPHVVTSAIEHPAVLATLAALEERGLCSSTAVPVSSEGVVDAAAVRAAVRPGETVLVTVMHSNNEAGRWGLTGFPPCFYYQLLAPWPACWCHDRAGPRRQHCTVPRAWD